MEKEDLALKFAESVFAAGDDGKPVANVTIPAAAAFLPASMLRAYILAVAARDCGCGDLDVRALVKVFGFQRTVPLVWRYQITPNRRGESNLPCRVVVVRPDWTMAPGKAECLLQAALFWQREFWKKGEGSEHV